MRSLRDLDKSSVCLSVFVHINMLGVGSCATHAVQPGTLKPQQNQVLRSLPLPFARTHQSVSSANLTEYIPAEIQVPSDQSVRYSDLEFSPRLAAFWFIVLIDLGRPIRPR